MNAMTMAEFAEELCDRRILIATSVAGVFGMGMDLARVTDAISKTLRRSMVEASE